jgi:hypothetical protein
MAVIHRIGTPENDSEARAIKRFAKDLPDDCFVFHNFEVCTGRGLPYEYEHQRCHFRRRESGQPATRFRRRDVGTIPAQDPGICVCRRSGASRPGACEPARKGEHLKVGIGIAACLLLGDT